MAGDLSRELEIYKQMLPTLAGDEGKFALIVGDELVGKFESYGDALSAGYSKAGLSPFLVKKISVTEIVSYFTRDLNIPCPQ